MIFDQLIEYNVKLFLEKLYIKYGAETSSRNFLEKLKLTTSLNQ